MKVGFLFLTLAVLASARVQMPSSSMKKLQRVEKFHDYSDTEHTAVLTASQAVSSGPTAEELKSGILSVLGGSLVHLAFGTLYCWGNFLSYAPSHLRFYDGKSHTGQPDALIVLPAALIAQCITMPLGPLFVKVLLILMYLYLCKVTNI